MRNEHLRNIPSPEPADALLEIGPLGKSSFDFLRSLATEKLHVGGEIGEVKGRLIAVDGHLWCICTLDEWRKEPFDDKGVVVVIFNDPLSFQMGSGDFDAFYYIRPEGHRSLVKMYTPYTTTHTVPGVDYEVEVMDTPANGQNIVSHDIHPDRTDFFIIALAAAAKRAIGEPSL